MNKINKVKKKIEMNWFFFKITHCLYFNIHTAAFCSRMNINKNHCFLYFSRFLQFHKAIFGCGSLRICNEPRQKCFEVVHCNEPLHFFTSLNVLLSAPMQVPAEMSVLPQ